MRNTDIVKNLQLCPQNHFAKFLLQKFREKEVMLSKGFLVKDDPDQPVYQLPEWFDTTIGELEIKKYWIYNFFEECEEAAHELWLTNGFFVKGNEWFEDLWIKWSNQISSVFILSGNINDYAFNHMKGYMPTTDFIVEEFLSREKGTDCVITFSMSRPFCINRKGDIVLEKVSRLEEKVNLHLEKRTNISEIFNKLIEDFQFLDELLLIEKNLVISISNANLIFANESSNIYQNLLSDYLLTWAFSPKVARNNNAIILITESNESINRHLISQSSKLESIHIPRPKIEEERLKFILFLHSLSKQIISTTTNTRAKNVVIPTKSEGFRTISLKDNLLGLSKQTSGLNFIGIEDLLLQIQAKGESSESVINRVKADILQTESGGVLELVSSNKDLDKDICGYFEIKKRLTVISEIIGSNCASRLQQRIIPMGILFVGPPGTGKTVVAQAFSKKCKMNFLKLGDFRSKWVGESERILSKVLELIKSYSPVIVFIDELDQSEGSRGTSSNSDVDKRTFSKLLQFMSDTENRGKVLWIAASNRPDLIDAALKRPGRFDLKIPFLPQNADERKETFARYLFDKKIPELSSDISDIEWEEIKKSTDGYTGAEIEEIVNSCIRKKIMEDNTPTVQILGSNVIGSIEEFNPGIKSKVFQDMVDVSLADITSIDLIPIEWRGDWKKRFNIQSEAI